MHITSLVLRNFRSYEGAEVLPGEGMTVFSGPNAQGKTNILEAMHLCCTGRSHRTSHDEEMIRWGMPAARVSILSSQKDGTHEVSVILTKGQKKKKSVRIGAREAERIGELFGHVFGVLFSPEDLMIVKGGPSERRRFVDMQLSQLRPSYFYTLQQAAHILVQRNALLRAIAENPSLEGTLDVWDEQLSLAGASVVRARREVIGVLSSLAYEEHKSLTDGKEELRLRYNSEASQKEDPAAFLLQRLHETRSEDIRRMSTGTGVHRDDIAITINGKDARTYASQGQQRSAVLSLKLAQTSFAEMERGEAPVLMLDDVMSELDPDRRRQLIERIGSMQTFVTCTDISDLAGAEKGRIYQVREGKLYI